MKYYFIVGSSAAGKSTTERNLRLRLTGNLLPGNYQLAPEEGLIFAGRVLFNNGKRVLRFSGGDATGYSRNYLLNAPDYIENTNPEVTYDKVLYEKYHVPISVYEELVRRKGEIVVFHIEVDRSLAIARLKSLDHPTTDEDKNPYYRPGDQDYQDKRDSILAHLGIQVVYVSGDVRSRCEFIETYIGVKPKYDNIVYDFQMQVKDIVSKFMAGGDKERPFTTLVDLNREQ